MRCFRAPGTLARQLGAVAHFDLRNPLIHQIVRGWINSYQVAGLLIGTPCGTFSAARRGPPGSSFPRRLRTVERPRGISDLAGADRKLVLEANVLADRAFDLLSVAYRRGLPGIEENPNSSILWHQRNRRAFQEWPHVHDVTVDYCQFGTPFRKRTRLRHWHFSLMPVLSHAQCTGTRGPCSRTNRPHQLLRGSHEGTFNTKLGEVYPDELCSVLACAMHKAIERSRASALGKYMKLGG